MKVFISWSGDRSLAIARALSEFLPLVLQSVQPYMSADSIEKGQRWASEIARAIESADAAILCITPENVGSPGLLFEAGVISARSVPLFLLLLDMSPVDVSGPLGQFQFLTSSRDDMHKLLMFLNERLPNPLPETVLGTVFAAFWPRLEARFADVSGQTKLTTHEDETRAVTKLREDIETARDDARRNIEALTATSSAYVTVTYCLIQLPLTTDANIKTKLIANCDSALNSATNVIDKYKPTDSNILAWAFTIRGTVLHLREDFEAALKDFEAALEINPDRGPTLYNAACSACRLGFEKKALSYIKRALEIQPGRRDEARTDPDLDAVRADI